MPQERAITNSESGQIVFGLNQVPIGLLEGGELPIQEGASKGLMISNGDLNAFMEMLGHSSIAASDNRSFEIRGEDT